VSDILTPDQLVDLPGGLSIRVAPPIVTALLKIIAYVEDPYRRAKDLQDIRIVCAAMKRKVIVCSPT
jgi:hypothetical protein